MPDHLNKALRPLLLTLALILALASCSRIDVAYRNLDVLVPWSLDDYLDMNRQQKSWLDERLKQHLAWHCQTQLPGYLDWLDRIRRMVARNEVTDQQLQDRTVEARQAIGRVAEAITPSAAELLRGMSDEQVEEMREAFGKDIRERQAKYVDTPLAEQIERRAERMEKRLKPWLGDLLPGQRQRVDAWSRALGEQNRQWIANRAHWQQQFSQVVEQRRSDTFEPRLAQLLQQKESLWTPEYRIAFRNTERQTRGMIVDLMQQSTEKQRQYLDAQLAKVRSNFSELKCLGG